MGPFKAKIIHITDEDRKTSGVLRFDLITAITKSDNEITFYYNTEAEMIRVKQTQKDSEGLPFVSAYLFNRLGEQKYLRGIDAIYDACIETMYLD